MADFAWDPTSRLISGGLLTMYSLGRRVRELLRVSSTRTQIPLEALVPFTKIQSPWPNHVPQTLSAYTIRIVITTSTYGSGGHKCSDHSRWYVCSSFNVWSLFQLSSWILHGKINHDLYIILLSFLHNLVWKQLLDLCFQRKKGQIKSSSALWF